MGDSDLDQLKKMVMTFRVSELQMLLGYAGKNKTGRKNELQSRAMDVVKLRNTSIQQKIRELYKSIQIEMMSYGDRSQPATGASATPILPAQKVPIAMNTLSGYSQTATSGYTSRSQTAAQLAQVNQSMAYNMQPSHNSSYPIISDVKLKCLPFYDVLGDLLKPSTLAPQGTGRYQESTFTFSLTPQQANKIANSRDLRPGKDYVIQVQMRFCLQEISCEQEDNFPPNLVVKINDKPCPLPNPIPTNKTGVEPKRPPRPINITSLCRISPTVTNRIQVSWGTEFSRCYVISVYLVQKLTSDDLLQRLKGKGSRLADFTKSLIKQKLMEDAECEIATTSLRCSLLCPLGKMRMVLPCRADTCNHLQCFDASLYLQMNERKPTWTCPVCDKPALYDNLVIDGYFQDVLIKGISVSEVTLQQDGSWTPLIPKKEKEPQVEKRAKAEVSIETLSDDSDDDEEEISDKEENDGDSVVEELKKRKAAVVEIITLSDSDSDCAASTSPTPASKRQAYNSSNNTPTSQPPSHNSITTTTNATTNKSENNDCSSSPSHNANINTDSSNGIGCASAQTNAASSPSSGSASPQVICLDTPTSSPVPSPTPQQNTSQSPPPISSTPQSQMGSTSSPHPASPSAVATSLASLGSELRPLSNSSPVVASGGTNLVTITPVPPTIPTSDAYNLMNSLQTSPYALPTGAGSNANNYPLASSLQNIFPQMGGLIPPTSLPPATSPQNMNSYRSDQYM